MPGPWEDYKQEAVADGPWNDYAQAPDAGAEPAQDLEAPRESMLEHIGLPSPTGALRRLSGIDAARSLGQMGVGAAENMQADQDVIRSAFERLRIPGANLTTPVIASEVMEFVTPKSAFEVYTMLTPVGAYDDATKLAVKAVPAAVARKTGAAGRALLALAERHGIPMSAADIVDSKTLASIENYIEKTPLGSGAINAFRDKQLAALRALRDRVAGRLGTEESKEVAGSIFKEALKEASQAAHANAELLYADVAEKSAGRAIGVANLKRQAQSLFDEEAAKLAADRNPAIINLVREVLGDDVANLNFSQMAGKRVKYNQIIASEDAAIMAGQQGQKFLSTPYARAAKLLKGAMRQDLDEFAKVEGGEIKTAYDLANSFYGEVKEKFANKTIRRLTNMAPEKVAAFLFKPGNISEIRFAKAAVGPEAFEKLRATFVYDLMSKLTSEKFSPGAINRELAKYGDETLKEIFTTGELADIHDLGTLSQAAQRAQSLSGTFGSARSNTMSASFGGVLLAAQHIAGLPTAAGILLGPKVIAHMYLSKAGRRLLIEGFSTTAQGEAAARLVARVGAFLGPKIPKTIRDVKDQIEKGESQRSERRSRREPEPERRERPAPKREASEPEKRTRTIRERVKERKERRAKKRSGGQQAAQTGAALSLIEQDEALQQRKREGA